ncbi:MAG: hypothetical protein JW839_05945 [Candidatus Lokiarchaeota archaeon]|nr:hypothetical protein [Candidatus Lokiarchaeota archaeon]
MSRKNWESIEGVIDVGPIVIAHCNNPVKSSMVTFLQNVLVGKIRALLPVTAFLGAYHVLTRYLRVARHDAVLALEKTLAVESPAFYETVTREEAKSALTISSINKLESWDGYVINIAREFGTRLIYSIDKKLEKDDFKVIIPIPDAELKLYHEWVKKLVK